MDTPISSDEREIMDANSIEWLRKENERLLELIFAVNSNAKAIVIDQTEMHPAHRELVQMLVDATQSDADTFMTWRQG